MALRQSRRPYWQAARAERSTSACSTAHSSKVRGALAVTASTVGNTTGVDRGRGAPRVDAPARPPGFDDWGGRRAEATRDGGGALHAEHSRPAPAGSSTCNGWWNRAPVRLARACARPVFGHANSGDSPRHGRSRLGFPTAGPAWPLALPIPARLSRRLSRRGHRETKKALFPGLSQVPLRGFEPRFPP